MVPQAEAVHQRGGDLAGPGDLGEGDEAGPVPEVGRDLPRHLHRQARLADPRGAAHEGHAAGGPPQEPPDLGDVVLPAEEGQGRKGQADPVGRLPRHPQQVVLRCGGDGRQPGHELRRGTTAAPFDLGHVGHVVAERLGQAFLGPPVGVPPFPDPRAQAFGVGRSDRTDGGHLPSRSLSRFVPSGCAGLSLACSHGAPPAGD